MDAPAEAEVAAGIGTERFESVKYSRVAVRNVASSTFSAVINPLHASTDGCLPTPYVDRLIVDLNSAATCATVRPASTRLIARERNTAEQSLGATQPPMIRDSRIQHQPYEEPIDHHLQQC